MTVAPSKHAGGRPAVFPGKDREHPAFHGFLTPRGRELFEWQRMRLAKIYRVLVGIPIENISDADVIEFLARGEAETKAYLRNGKAK